MEWGAVKGFDQGLLHEQVRGEKWHKGERVDEWGCKKANKRLHCTERLLSIEIHMRKQCLIQSHHASEYRLEEHHRSPEHDTCLAGEEARAKNILHTVYDTFCVFNPQDEDGGVLLWCNDRKKQKRKISTFKIMMNESFIAESKENTPLPSPSRYIKKKDVLLNI